MKKSASKKKEKIRDKIVDCEFSQKEFLLFKKKYSGTSDRLNQTELQNIIFIMAKKLFRKVIINIFGLLFFSIPGMVAGYPGWVFWFLQPVFLIYMAVYITARMNGHSVCTTFKLARLGLYLIFIRQP
ncbi:hypothetical protein [Escherichia sp. E13S3]|uniref:hypothetical protein n=1 Tax=Escherichia sp. E13S3 TaxID=2484854 RepID=UPI001029E968|nr:hypothetical protein [Escherichia sp. E13S3]RZN46511.1 hypothetical protein D9597_17600 [Escherichia sp. E13S3]